ncbi:MAG: hypothetical protein HON94_09855 [Methylococcales bacterium]|jgi:hypothetical protein|nr:hypothetical protein [Methylococcales bacterium]MBT7409360.1 hypothetical protein [Methylococcales bacterium]
MDKSSITQDHFNKNFSDKHLVRRLKKNIYNNPKGKLRLKFISSDFSRFIPEINQKQRNIIDTGCGFAQFALELKKSGHQLSCCETGIRCFLDFIPKSTQEEKTIEEMLEN